MHLSVGHIDWRQSQVDISAWLSSGTGGAVDPRDVLKQINERAKTAGARIDAAHQQQQAQVAQAQAQQLGADKVAVLGNAVWLLTQVPTHKHLFISDLEWLLLPAIALNQFRLWRKGNIPVAFATWAYMSDEAEARMKEGVRRIAPMDWKSGENLWLMDMICPFGGQDEAMKELKEKAFSGQAVKTLQPAPTGEGMAVVEF